MTTLTLPATAASTRLAPLTAELTFIKRSIIHTLRTPDALVMAIALPSILMLLFTYVFGGAIEEDGSYVNYVVPGIILCARDSGRRQSRWTSRTTCRRGSSTGSAPCRCAPPR
jgi:ABC-2 type transport system permease protein